LINYTPKWKDQDEKIGVFTLMVTGIASKKMKIFARLKTADKSEIPVWVA
jgi:hypothetical protein